MKHIIHGTLLICCSCVICKKQLLLLLWCEGQLLIKLTQQDSGVSLERKPVAAIGNFLCLLML